MRILLAAVALTLLGCPPKDDAKKSGPPAAASSCSRFGQNCIFSPGKLGTCEQRVGCSGDDCLVCQSQH
jgi:hypothetical protein